MSMREIELATAIELPAEAGWRDWAGIFASLGCAIHCALMPFVMAYLPLIGLSFLADEAFHRWMALTCFLIAMAAFVPGIRQHRRWQPAVLGVVGLLLISGAAFGLSGDCCAACTSDTGLGEDFGSKSIEGSLSTRVVSVSAIPEAEPSALPTQHAACTDACCEHCAEASAAEIAETNFAAGDSTIMVASAFPLDTLGPWLTPLGGIFLVVAHLLNRRYVCLCGCC